MFGLAPYRRAERKLAREFERAFGLARPNLPALMEEMFGRWPLSLEPLWKEEVEPFERFEVEEKEKEVFVRVGVPGFEPTEVVVEIGNGILYIRAEHKEKEVKEEKEMPEKGWMRMERSILLPPGIEIEKIEATCRNGLLEIVLPKKPEVVVRKVEVKT